MLCFAVSAICLLAGARLADSPLRQTAVISVRIDPGKRRQEILGFGASQTYGADSVLRAADPDPVFKALYTDLRLDFLRLRNYYDYAGQEPAFERVTKTYVAGAEKWGRSPERGDKGPVRYIFSSWSPPARLKSNDRVQASPDGTQRTPPNGTLKKGPDGKYVYGAYADWWVDSLKKFQSLTGLLPDYVTLQNELDLVNPINYEGCRFNPTEGVSPDGFPLAGYDQALAMCRQKIRGAFGKSAPKIAGPECWTIRMDSGDSQLKPYIDPGTPAGRKVLRNLDAIAFHIYDSYFEKGDYTKALASLKRLSELYRGVRKPLIETEYLWGNTTSMVAKIMCDCFNLGDFSGYLVWYGAQAGGFGTQLIAFNPRTGQVSPGNQYYAVKHFSAFVGPGWRRIESSSDDPDVRVCAFRKDRGQELVTVIVNPTSDARIVRIDGIPNGAHTGAFRTTDDRSGDKFAPYTPTTDGKVELPPKSVITLETKF